MLTINSHSECVSKQVKLMTVAYIIRIQTGLCKKRLEPLTKETVNDP